MKALTVTNQAVTREGLLQLAETVPGAWTGIRIAALLLMLDGLKSTRVAELFGISRWSMVKWVQRVNGEGLSGVEEKPKPGRPARFDTGVRKKSVTSGKAGGMYCEPLKAVFKSWAT